MGNRLSAILLAAGSSSRMGQPKMLLPWDRTSVLGQVISVFSITGMEEIVVVTGGARDQVEEMVTGFATKIPVRTIFNPVHASGGMLSSIQAGLAVLDSRTSAVLIGLGDQPQVMVDTIRKICIAYVKSKSLLVIPSYQNRRGHPWLIARPLWSDLLALPISMTSREFINSHSDLVEYIDADQSILQDLDTPEDYSLHHP